MQSKKLPIALRAALAILVVTLLVTSTRAVAPAEKVLHSFNDNGKDGSNPYAALIFDGSGNLYGTTQYGGKYGYGTAFELSPKTGGGWTETVLHSFGKGTDGEVPFASLIFDRSGNLYGTTFQGGKYSYGTVFELSPKTGGGWTETILHSFNNRGNGGSSPEASLIFDRSGNLYGTTYNGGKYGYGTVFEFSPKTGGGWTEIVLHNFNDRGKDGTLPKATLILDASGNLYGTTWGGYGTVFELLPKTGGGWAEVILHNFNQNGTDGYSPNASLIFDASGNLYGTTNAGGKYSYGTVFELSPKTGGDWAETILHNFNDSGNGGYDPYAALIFDVASGNLYGTAGHGGEHGAGTAFELSPKAGGGWTETVLHSFGYGTDGQYPFAGLTFDASGNLYGTTQNGGTHGDGTVFEITP